MLASFVVHLRPRHPAVLGHTLGRSLHGLLLRLISETNPVLANALHSDSQSKPFTVSMLQGRLVRKDGQPVAVPDELYQVRYTVLTDEVFNALSHILLGKVLFQGTVDLDGQPFQVEEIVVDPAQSDGWGGISTFEKLAEEADANTRIALRFSSPTTFRTGDVNLLFPLATSVFGSLVRRWSAFAPTSLPEGLAEFVEAYVHAERYTLETQVVGYRGHQFNGFVGTCQYRVFAEDRGLTQALNALADFALYAGVGQKTTQGLGQTKRLLQ